MACNGEMEKLIDDDRAICNILTCVIGEALMEADANFMFGYDFTNIVNKYASLLRKASTNDIYIKKDFDELRLIIDEINKSQPFLGISYQLVQDKINRLENKICK